MWARVLFLLCVLPAWTLHAQEPASQDYATLVREAVLAQQDGDYGRAIALFQAAHQRSPNARTLRGLGVAEFLAGQPVSAIAHLEAALTHPEKPLDAELRKAVEELLVRARSQVASYRLETSPEGVMAVVDGGEPQPARGLSLVLAPGEHELVLSVEGYLSETLELKAQAGTREVLRVALAPELAQAQTPVPSLSLVPAPLAAKPTPSPAPPLPHVPSVREERMRRAKWATLAVGAAGAITASVLLFTAARRSGAINEQLRSECQNKDCAAYKAREEERARLDGLRTGFIVSTSVAGAALGSSLGLWLVELRGHSRPDSPPLESVTLSYQRRF